MDRIDMIAPVIDVTVLEDRAQVLRRGRITVPAGASLLAIGGVAPVLADKSLIARVAAGARAVDVRCERLALPVIDDPARRDVAAQEGLRQAEQRVEDLEQTIGRIEARLAQAEALGKLVAGEIGGDVAAGRADPDGWRAALADAAARDLAQRRNLIASQSELDDANRTVADRRARLQALGAVPPMRANVVVTIEADTAGEVELEIGYVVPGACWRPAHTAVLDGAALHWSAEGAVWQSTGEDWQGITLHLSTDRASLGTEPPDLSADRLHLRPREQAVVVEARDRAVEDNGPAGGGGASQEMPGIDDGGEVRVLLVQGAATVPADGRPHRFPLATFTAPAAVELVVHGEITPAAVLRSRQTNPLPAPLLAGPVDLIRGGGLAGRASIAYVAAGAAFDLGWGPDAAIRVRRSERTVEEKAGVLSGWTPRLHAVDLVISNLGGEVRRLAVAERVPVSEVEQVKIEVDAATAPPAKPDADGICRWDVHLSANGRSEVRLRWRMLTKGDVVGV
jgi:uncharacterized protein (TIGR02231 family)